MRVLVVDDEKRLALSLRVGLEAEGFAVDLAHDGTDGLWLARENAYDAIVLDLMLPGINGYKVCETLRAEKNWTPILMLTAREFSVLGFLARHQGDVVSKRQVLEAVWDVDFDGDPNIVEVYVRHLRNKIDRPFGREAIQTLRGAGYRLGSDGG
jgi:DNA-binding response OmpR family regulator